jgi:hypothetical protein
MFNGAFTEAAPACQILTVTMQMNGRILCDFCDQPIADATCDVPFRSHLGRDMTQIDKGPFSVL